MANIKKREKDKERQMINQQEDFVFDFAYWQKRYLENDLPWDTGIADFNLKLIIEKFHIHPNKALDIGCGTGTNSIWLDSQGFNVLGLDLSTKAIEIAKEKAKAVHSSSQFLCLDFLKDKVPGAPFKFAYDRGCFHGFDTAEERASFAAGIAGLLETGGLWHSLIGSLDGPAQTPGPPRRSALDITLAIEPYFEIVLLDTTVFEQDNPNSSKAWLLVARKR